MAQNVLPLAGMENLSSHSQQNSFNQQQQFSSSNQSQNYAAQYSAQSGAQSYSPVAASQRASNAAPSNESATEFLNRLKKANLAAHAPAKSKNESQFSMFTAQNRVQEHGYTETIADRLTRRIVRSDFDREGRLYSRYCESPSFWYEERFDSSGRQISRTEVDRTTGRGKVLKAGPNGAPMITEIFYDSESTKDTRILSEDWQKAV